MLGCNRAEQCHSVPSPLAGEGQGEGYHTHCICCVSMSLTNAANILEGEQGTGVMLSASSPPLSLSLPRHKGVHARLRRAMGGGNRVARTFATQAMCSRMNVCIPQRLCGDDAEICCTHSGTMPASFTTFAHLV